MFDVIEYIIRYSNGTSVIDVYASTAIKYLDLIKLIFLNEEFFILLTIWYWNYATYFALNERIF